MVDGIAAGPGPAQSESHRKSARTLRAIPGAATLAIISNPNAGTLQTQATLPFDSNGALTGYDISGLTGTPYFSVTAGTSGSSSFYMGTSLVGTIGGGVSVMDIAAPVGSPVPEPAGVLLSGAGLLAMAVWGRRRQ